MAILDIIITHHRERWEDGRKLFEGLKLQRGVRREDYRVILVQDGEDDRLDIPFMLREYPFIEEVEEIPHGGVSRARNHGLDRAESTWVMFCDFDDTFYSVDSLQRTIQSIQEAGELADLIYSDFWMETERKDGGYSKALKGWNLIFIHGKCWRREFLNRNGIRFDEELSYSEDALFCETASMDMDPRRIGRMPEVVYVWCMRHGSLSNYTGGEGKRNLSLYRKRVKLIEEYEKRGRIYDAKCMCARLIIEYYWELCGGKKLEGKTGEEWTEMIRRDAVRRYPGMFYEVSPHDLGKIWNILSAGAERDGKKTENIKPIGTWLSEIGAIKQEDAGRVI